MATDTAILKRRWPAPLPEALAGLLVLAASILAWRAAGAPGTVIGLARDGMSLAAGALTCRLLLEGSGASRSRRTGLFIAAAGLAAFVADAVLVLQFGVDRPRLLLGSVLAIYLATGAGSLAMAAFGRPGIGKPLVPQAVLLAAAVAMVVADGRIMRFAVTAVAATVIIVAGAALFPRSSASYRKSGATSADLEQSYRALIDKAESLRLYRRPDLSLDDLATAANVPRRLASHALSAVGRTSFSRLMAELRVAEAARLLAAPENNSVAVEPIGMEAGFRSRSSFYAAFRKVHGVTPVQYRAAVRN